MSPSTLDVRAAIVGQGYVPIPVIGKKPPLGAWQTITAVSRAMLEDWDRDWPSARNTGLLTRTTPTLDIDLLNEPAALAAEAMVRERYESRGQILVRIGRHPKRAIPFRTASPFKKITTTFVVAPGQESEKLEFLADGQQFVADGIHPDTQREYLWSGGDPRTVPYDELPEISGSEARELQDALVTMLVRDFGYTATVAKGNGHSGGTGRGKAARKNMAKDEAWARSALDAECALVAAAAPGDRNAQLNISSYNIFQIVWGDPSLLREEEVRARLFEAARTCGLVNDDGDDSVLKTIQSAAEGARSQPRTRPVPTLITATGLNLGGAGGAPPSGAGPSSPSPSPSPSPAGPARAPGLRPVIQLIEGQRHDIVNQAEAALIQAGGFDLYQRDAIMVRPVMQKLPAAGWHGMKRTTTSWRLMRVKPLYLNEMLGRAARFQSWDGRKRSWVDKDCPQVVAETLLARDGAWNLPMMLGIVHTPQLRADGSLLSTPGYDPATRLLYKPDGEIFPDIPERPTRDEALGALAIVKAAISTFPFVNSADLSVALSLLLTGICRRTLDFALMHTITAPAPGTGKSLLIDLIAILLTGQPAPVLSAEVDDAEFEKRLGACLMAGDPIISFDNCVKPLNHALLCQALTQTRLNLRVLGFSENRDVTMGALLTATGNNLVLSADLPRRSLRCTLDAKVERPELRVFPGPRIQDEFRRRRGELVAALLTILRARRIWGGDTGVAPFGGFEMWSYWVRDALLWLGEVDPCDTIEAIRASDPARERHQAVILGWRDCIGLGAEPIVRELIETVNPMRVVLQQQPHHQRLYDALLAVAADPRQRGAISPERLGRWLNTVNGKYEHGLKIVKVGMTHGYPRWRLQT